MSFLFTIELTTNAHTIRLIHTQYKNTLFALANLIVEDN